MKSCSVGYICVIDFHGFGLDFASLLDLIAICSVEYNLGLHALPMLRAVNF